MTDQEYKQTITNRVREAVQQRITELKQQMRESKALPDWFKTIGSKTIRDQLLTKMAEGYLQYQRQTPHQVNIADFVRQYETFLKQNDKLHTYCTYKGKPVTLDNNNWCTEPYCSKKPYKRECPKATLRFGTQSNDK